jgi:Tfp pilus assembly protein PilF
MFFHNWEHVKSFKVPNKTSRSHFFRTVILAHINIGLIYLLHLDNYTEAIWHFSEAIKIDPLYIQSYICKAESYHKVFKV